MIYSLSLRTQQLSDMHMGREVILIFQPKYCDIVARSDKNKDYIRVYELYPGSDDIRIITMSMAVSEEMLMAIFAAPLGQFAFYQHTCLIIFANIFQN